MARKDSVLDHASTDKDVFAEFRSIDVALRAHGYAIYSRPERGEPLWSLGTWREGDPVYTQNHALGMIGFKPVKWK